MISPGVSCDLPNAYGCGFDSEMLTAKPGQRPRSREAVSFVSGHETILRPASTTHLAVAPTGSLVLKELTIDVNKLPIEDFEDLSLVYSKH